MSDPVSPRGTFLKIAEVLKGRILSDPHMTELPSVAELMHEHGVSRGVVLRSFAVLQEAGVAKPHPGGRWRVLRAEQPDDRRTLEDQIAEVITTEGLKVGDDFLSASELSSRLGVSRPTVGKALSKLEAAGLLSGGRQGKVRSVLAVPSAERRA